MATPMDGMFKKASELVKGEAMMDGERHGDPGPRPRSCGLLSAPSAVCRQRRRRFRRRRCTPVWFAAPGTLRGFILDAPLLTSRCKRFLRSPRPDDAIEDAYSQPDAPGKVVQITVSTQPAVASEMPQPGLACLLPWAAAQIRPARSSLQGCEKRAVAAAPAGVAGRAAQHRRLPSFRRLLLLNAWHQLHQPVAPVRSSSGLQLVKTPAAIRTSSGPASFLPAS